MVCSRRGGSVVVSAEVLTLSDRHDLLHVSSPLLPSVQLCLCVAIAMTRSVLSLINIFQLVLALRFSVLKVLCLRVETFADVPSTYSS